MTLDALEATLVALQEQPKFSRSRWFITFTIRVAGPLLGCCTNHEHVAQPSQRLHSIINRLAYSLQLNPMFDA
jgi:hypothetical protein